MDHNNMDHMGHDHHMMMNNLSTTTAASMSGHDHSHHMVADNGMNHSGMDHGAMDHSTMDHSDMMMDHGMKMYFHFSQNATVLFDFWKVSSWEGMLGSCIAVFIMAALYEGLKVLREYLLRRSNVMVRYNTVPVTNGENSTMISENPQKTIGTTMCSIPHFVQTLMHIFQVILSYFLMLIFMTYNMWLCIAVALGAGTGYFLFSWRRAIVVDINEHCH